MNNPSLIAHFELLDLCHKAVKLLETGAHKEAESLLQDARDSSSTSPIFHRVNALIQLILHEFCNNSGTRSLHFQEAVSSAKQATLLSPFDLEYSLFYIKLLILYSDRYEEGAQECHRALSIDPIDCEAEDASKVRGQIAKYQEQLISNLESKTERERCKRIAEEVTCEETLSILNQLRRNQIVRIPVAEFEEYCSSYGENGVSSKRVSLVVREALDFARVRQKWRFWGCPECLKRCRDYESLLEHVSKKHVGNLNEELMSLLPRQVDSGRLKKLLEGFDNVELKSPLPQQVLSMFEVLRKTDRLADSYLDFVEEYVLSEVQAPEPCLRFLDCTGFQKVFAFLQDMWKVYSESVPKEEDKFSTELSELENLNVFFRREAAEEIILGQNSTCLTVKPPEFPADSSLSVSVISWLNEGPSWKQSSDEWSESIKRARKILEKLKNEFENLHSLCLKKIFLISSRDALQSISELGNREFKDAPSFLMKLNELAANDTRIRHVQIESISIMLENGVPLVLAIRCLEEAMTAMLCKKDAEIKESLLYTRQLQLNLAVYSSKEYHSLLVPLLKSYLRKEN